MVVEHYLNNKEEISSEIKLPQIDNCGIISYHFYSVYSLPLKFCNLWFETMVSLSMIKIIIKAANHFIKKQLKHFGFILSKYLNQYSMISSQFVDPKGLGDILVGSWRLRNLSKIYYCLVKNIF